VRVTSTQLAQWTREFDKRFEGQQIPGTQEFYRTRNGTALMTQRTRLPAIITNFKVKPDSSRGNLRHLQQPQAKEPLDDVRVGVPDSGTAAGTEGEPEGGGTANGDAGGRKQRPKSARNSGWRRRRGATTEAEQADMILISSSASEYGGW